MKKIFFACLLLWSMAMGHAQMPQFSSTEFADWVYTNPATELNSTNILRNKIYLYTTSKGLDQTLTSPPFACHGGEIINMRVTWITDQWQNSNFVESKVALTAAIVGTNGVTVDSVTCLPSPVSRTNMVEMSLVVPRGMNWARLRFGSWKADVNSCGAVRQIVITSTNHADVNGDGEVNVADVNAIIETILGSGSWGDAADVNADGEVNVADVNAVIEAILG